jgi:hypothetical protein
MPNKSRNNFPLQGMAMNIQLTSLQYQFLVTGKAIKSKGDLKLGTYKQSIDTLIIRSYHGH